MLRVRPPWSSTSTVCSFQPRAKLTEDLTDRVRAGDLVRELAPIVGGRGGGKSTLAQAGGPDVGKLGKALEMAPETVGTLLASSAN